MENLLNISVTELVTTIITTIFSLAILIFQTSRKGKLKYITGERSDWRDQMRSICGKLGRVKCQTAEDRKEMLDEVLVDLKIRLNAYGKDRKTDYLWDGHIWEAIRSIEESSEFNVKEVNRLIEYITLLLKYDWERAKQEARINSKVLLSSIVFIISNLLFVYLLFDQFPDSGFVEICMALLVIFLAYFAPSIIKHIVTIFPSHGLAQSAWLHWILLIIYPAYCFLPDIRTLGSLNLVVVLQGVAAFIRALGEWEFYQKERQYIQSVKNIQASDAGKKGIRREQKKVPEERLESYKCGKVCCAPFHLGYIRICYARVLVKRFILRVVHKAYQKIEEVQKKIDHVESAWRDSDAAEGER